MAALVLQLVAEGLLDLDGRRRAVRRGRHDPPAPESHERPRRFRRRRRGVLRAVSGAIRPTAGSSAPRDELRAGAGEAAPVPAGRGVGVSRQQLHRAQARRRGRQPGLALRDALRATRPRAAGSGADRSGRRSSARRLRARLPAAGQPDPARAGRARWTSRSSTSRSTAPEAASSRPPARSPRCSAPCSAASCFPTDLRAEMLDAVESDWQETDRVRARHRRDHRVDGQAAIAVRSAWGHLGFSARLHGRSRSRARTASARS